MNSIRVAIVGGESLLGRELSDVLEREAPEVEVKRVGSAADAALLTEQGGEPVVLGALDTEELADAQLILVAAAGKTGAGRFPEARADLPPVPVIDLTYGFDQQPESELRAPLVEPPGWRGGTGNTYVIAHPAAIVLASFFERLQARHPIRRSVVHVLEPASERGREGVDELQRQTIQLLSFQSLPQEVFDAQLAFTLLPRYGSEARESLRAVEDRIRRHLSVLLQRAGIQTPPSLRLTQAPVFHGYSISVWTELETPAEPEALEQVLATERIAIRHPDEEPATNVGVAGQSGLTVGSVARDPDNPRAAWFWLVADNHRVSADNAVCLTRLLLPGRGAA